MNIQFFQAVSFFPPRLIEGLKEGRIKGEQIGLEKGKIEVAKNFLDILDIETIARKTGLSKEIIENLKKERE